MPDFTVIEGGGERRDGNHVISQHQFEIFVVWLLRSLASGDSAHRPTEELFRFIEHAQENKVPIGPVLEVAVRDLHAQAFEDKDAEGYAAETKRVTLAALRVAAESMAADSAAHARRSKRDDELQQAIEHKVLRSEIRSRENGWSYVAKLTERLGRWPLRRR